MYKFEVVLSTGSHGETEVFDVDADRHDITCGGSDGLPPFIVFHRDAPRAAETELQAEPPLEVFRAPVHVLIAVKLVDDDEEDEPEVHP